MPPPAPRVYIAESDGSNKVYFDGLNAPWPEVPKRTYERQGSSETMIPGWDGVNKTPGRTITQDYGVHESSGKIDVKIEFMEDDYSTLATVADLNAKYASLGLMEYSPNDGWDTWIVAWRPGEVSMDPEPIAGFPGKYSVTLKLNVVLRNAEIGS